MPLAKTSKREHCPACPSTRMENLVYVRPGRDVEVFVECAECGAFVARYTLKMYTGDHPYRSFLRLMRARRMSSGAATQKASQQFIQELEEGLAAARSVAAEGPPPPNLEDVLDQTLSGERDP